MQNYRLQADIGTPCFSMYDGEVFSTRSNLKDQHYDRSFGNYIVVRSIINGKIYDLQYSHLQSGNAIALNPRTLQPFQIHDFVFRGEIIGYTGRSGNTWNDDSVPTKHLHLGIKDDHGKWVNPAQFINGTIDSTTINQSRGKITNIICN